MSRSPTVPLARRLLLLGLVWALLPAATAAAADHSLGFGLHFWKTVDDLASDFGDGIEDDGFAWVASYQYIPAGLIRFELDLEYYDEGFGGSTKSAISPVGFVMLGKKLYGALGLGVTLSDGSTSDPFYAARIGWQLTLLPGLRIDLNANYRANAFDDLGQADTDAITLGAIVRFNL